MKLQNQKPRGRIYSILKKYYISGEEGVSILQYVKIAIEVGKVEEGEGRVSLYFPFQSFKLEEFGL